MIERYSRAVMRNIWTEENKFNAYLEVEILAAEAWSTLGVVPVEDVKLLREKATFDVNRIHEIEEITRHDVVAFTRAVYLISNESDPFGCVAFARPPIERQLGFNVPERLQRLLTVLALRYRLERMVGEMVRFKCRYI